MKKIDVLEKQAIEFALNHQWDQAIDLNKRILKIDTKNISAYLRLAFAYLRKNKINQSKKTYQKLLKLQPANLIAQENLEKIAVLEEKKVKKLNRNSLLYLDPNIFLEIPGKTAVVQLINLGQKNILAQLSVGQKLILRIRKRKIEARTENNYYVGFLPDDISRRLIFFIKAKSQYSCYIKEIGLKKLVVFIKEEEKGEKVAEFISFPKNLQSNIEALKRTDADTDTEWYEKDKDSVITDEIEELAVKLDEENQFSGFDLPEETEIEEEE
jgi:tetratricopeptide (TPR) repeat protein